MRQSIVDILTTRIGTRVMRRTYGSRLPELVDRPLNDALQVEIMAATADALRRWEPRLKVERVIVLETKAEGRIALDLHGIYQPTAEPITLEGIIVS